MMQPSRDFSRLTEIMARLRDTETGCAWDLEQNFETIRHYTIEEAYEVADAIERKDYAELCEELGDLLLQPVYHAQMASEDGLFDIGDVVEAITKKLIRRHPHVFGDTDARAVGLAKGQWEQIKSEERAEKRARKSSLSDPAVSVLDDVPRVMPALARAQKLDKRAVQYGFDWPDTRGALEKCREELDEIEEVLDSDDHQHLQEEIGDLLLAVASMARHAGIDAEAALTDANQKFTRRFKYVEQRCAENDVAMENAGFERLDGYWNEIRQKDKLAKF